MFLRSLKYLNDITVQHPRKRFLMKSQQSSDQITKSNASANWQSWTNLRDFKHWMLTDKELFPGCRNKGKLSKVSVQSVGLTFLSIIFVMKTHPGHFVSQFPLSWVEYYNKTKIFSMSVYIVEEEWKKKPPTPPQKVRTHNLFILQFSHASPHWSKRLFPPIYKTASIFLNHPK